MTNNLIKLTDGGDTLTYGAFTMTRTGLQVTGKPSYAEWEQCGHVLRKIEGAVQFWLGDWINYGEKSYGEKYTAAIEATGLDYQTVRDHAWVAAHVDLSLRKDNLPFSVHKEVAGLQPAQQSRILARAEDEGLTVRAVRDLVRSSVHFDKVERIERGELPVGEYDVVAADPPWQYDNSGFDQSAANHYPTLSTEAIAALPSTDPSFPKFADPCVLFLWATDPLLPSAITVLQAWGFEYRTAFVWVKDRAPGVGWWLKTRHEHLLIGVRGSVTPLERIDSVIAAAVDEHSRKPLEAYAAIARMFPGVRCVELFARAPRAGWSVWGNEV